MIFLLVAVFCLCFLLEIQNKQRRRRRPAEKLAITFFFKNQKIKGVSMNLTVKKSQFITDDDGSLFIKGHIAPTDDANDLGPVTNPAYVSSDETVGKIALYPDDPLSFKLQWVGAGSVAVEADAASAGGVPLKDSANLTFEDDSVPPPPPVVEVTKLNLGFDVAQPAS